MRRRLLVVLLTFAAMAVTGFAVPLLSSTAAERTQRLFINRTATLDYFEELAQQAVATGELTPLTEAVTDYAALYQEDVLILGRPEEVIVAAGDMTRDDPQLQPLIEGALRNERGQPPSPLRPWSDGKIVLTQPVGTDTHIVGVVALRFPIDAAVEDIRLHWTLITGGALAAAMGFVLLALVLARWILRPLAELERGVLAVTAGQQGAHVAADEGPREVRALAALFNQMSDAVAAATEQLRQFIADASHQLRNPMAALRLRVDTLAPSVPAAAQASYQLTVAEVERLQSLLDGLLALASADQMAAQLEPPDDSRSWPSDVAAARLDALQPAACQANVRLVNNLPAVPAVACAEEELDQILEILLDNAIKYAGPGATVTLRATIHADTVRLIVEDDGPGLSEQEREKVTRRFHRAAKHSGSTGIGLGLAIAEQRLASRRGTLEIKASDSGGLAVHVVLPRADEPEPDR